MIEYLNPLDLAWAAGIIDGEGCIHIRRDKASSKSRHASDHYALILKVTMTHESTIRRLHDIFKLGVVHYDGQRGADKPKWSWNCMSNDAFCVLLQVYLWMHTKKPEAKLAFEFIDLGSGRGGKKRVPPELLAERERLYWAMRDAKKNPLPLPELTEDAA